MYLRGSKWSMTRRRPRINWFWVFALLILITIGVYFDRVVLPTVPPPFIPTPTATRDPESYVAEAEILFKQGKLLQSINTYEQAIQNKPNDPTIYVSLARVQVFYGQYKDAQTSAEDALLLNPNNSMAHAVRGWALDFQSDFLASEAAIKRALDLDPNNAIAHAYYAELLVDQYLSNTGPFDVVQKAIDESNVAKSLAPNSLEAHRARGYVLEATANYEESLREYQAAAAINDNIADLHFHMANNYRAMSVYDKAIEEYTRANALNPADPSPNLYISRTYATVGEYAKAVQYAEQALNADPSNPRLHGNLGVMYYKNVDWPEAEKELAIAIKGGTTENGVTVKPVELVNDGRTPEFFFTYGLTLVNLHRCSEAIPLFQFILSKVPGDDLAVYNAEEGLKQCQQSLNNPQPTALPQVASTP
jgi:tetratricopeptide (TPR) repeat protein